MLVGPRYHESRRKIQMAVAPRMSKLQVNHGCFPDRPLHLAWLTWWPTGSSPSRKGLEWQHPCVLSAGTDRSHWWHPTRWHLYPGTDRVSPRDWHLSLQNVYLCYEMEKVTWEQTFSFWIWMLGTINASNIPFPEVHSDQQMHLCPAFCYSQPHKLHL